MEEGRRCCTGPELPGVSPPPHPPHTPPIEVITSNRSSLGAPGLRRRSSNSCIFPRKKIKPNARNDASRVIQPAMHVSRIPRRPPPTLFKLALEAEAWKGLGGGDRGVRREAGWGDSKDAWENPKRN